MNFLLHSHSTYLRRCHSHHHRHVRTLYDAVSSMKRPRDRGLDHAVERDRHLKPLLNLKNLIISEPSKSIPLSLITQSKETIGIPFRPIEFIRKYPSIFQEFHPGSLNIQPHIKLSPEIISLNSEENLLYQSVNYKQDIAGRLLKLLMISRINKVPIFLLEKLKWELGLPHDYETDVIPEFPDYFRVINGENEKVLELVCWSDEFAVSEMEKKGAKSGKIEFCLQYSNGFEMDKKYKKWVDEWQKLPYVSPYENLMHLAAKTDESDKWSVSVLHEVLSLFVGKKAERENMLYLGEYLGLRSRFKLTFLQHPGIFYVSSKIGTHTVVLREAYKRGMLIERHPLMDMRFKYAQLMNVVKDEEKPKKAEQKSGIDVKGEESEDFESGEEDEAEMYSSDDDDDDEIDDQGSEDENVARRGSFERKGAQVEDVNTRRRVVRMTNGRRSEENVDFEDESVTKRGRFKRNGADFKEGNTRRSVARRTNGRSNGEDVDFGDENATKRGRSRRNVADFEGGNTRSVARRINGRRNEENMDFRKENVAKRGRFRRNGADFEEGNARRSVVRRTNERRNKENTAFENENVAKRGRIKRNGADFEEWNSRSGVSRRRNGRSNQENVSKSSTRFSRRMNIRDCTKKSGSSGNTPI